MAYQVLARKWRPASFGQVVGQQHVLKALTNALEQDRLHHAYLFTGTRGVGKTSIARLFAKGLNCEQGVSAAPCGQCSACQEISQGRFVDLMEIDAASRTKVDDTREILDNVQYQPVRGRYKVYLIDEVHMLSRHSFNALLKTLEEPPPHVKFLLATTDPQKLPVTVLSRCLQFNLKSLPGERIAEHLGRVLQAEGIAFAPEAVNLLARAANGSVRDAMSLTDQAIAYGNGNIALAEVQAMLGTLDASYSLRLLQALVAGDLTAMMATLEEIDQFAPDYDELLKQLLELLHALAMTQFSVSAARLQEQGEALLPLARALSREQVQLWYQMLAEGRRDLALAPDPRSGLEMTLLRTLAFSPVTEVAPLTASLTDRPAALAATVAAQPAAVAQPEAVSPTQTVAETQPEAVPPTQPVAEAQPMMPQVGSSDPEVLAAEQQMLLDQAEQLRGEPASEFEPEPAGAPLHSESAPEPQSPQPEARPEPRPAAPQPEAEPAQQGGAMSLVERALANRQRLAQMGQGEEDSKKPEPLESRTPRGKTPPEPRTPPVTADEAPLPEPAQPQARPEVPPEPADTMMDSGCAPEAIPLEAYAMQPVSVMPEPVTPEPEPVQAEPAPAPVAAPAAVPERVQPEAAAAPSAPAPASEPNSGSGPSGNPEDLAWYQAIFDLGVAARARQLAINSLMERDGDRVRLLLKPEQRHLMHKSVMEQIREKMVALWQQPIELEVDTGEIPGRETPLEIRRRLHRERLAQAKVTLLEDPSVSWLMAEFDAQLIDESISYK